MTRARHRHRERLKHRLANRFIYSPFLRLLLFKPWFRVAVLMLVALLVFLSLFLPKIWRQTPAGVQPTVRVSGLDLLQAWSLQRTARRAAAAGLYEQAAYAWRAAIANNPADPDLLRGALRTLRQNPNPNRRDEVPQAAHQALWLLRLTHTNLSDLELVAEVLPALGLHPVVAPLLSERLDQLTPRLQAAYLKLLFTQGRWQEFADRWASLPSDTPPDPELSLYHDAFVAGSTSGEDARAARTRLNAALAAPEHRTLAARLLLEVASRRGDATDYERVLRDLQAREQETLLDHTRYWRLLAANGHKDQAAAEARACTRRPESAAELIALAEACEAIGARSLALERLAEHAQSFGSSLEVWATFAHLLLAAERWAELRDIALSIRQQAGAGPSLTGLSFILEGCAEHRLGRDTAAEDAFARALRYRLDNGPVLLAAAKQLLQLGHAGPARDLLLQAKDQFPESAEYWQLLSQAAEETKDEQTLALACERFYALQPHDPVAALRQAAALILTRQRPAEALKLTFQVYVQRPRSVAARVNHAFALVLNQRADEAATLLKAIQPDLLDPRERAAYDAAWVEVFLATGRDADARRLSGQINQDLLFPSQRSRLAALQANSASPEARAR